MVNYNNGKIYKIEPICEHEEGEIYIGSTTKDKLCQRMTKHRNDYNCWKNGKYHKFTSFDLFDKYGIENCKIYLIENVNANTKDELLSREGYYIRTMKCINKYIAGRTMKEYHEDNKDKIKQHNKTQCQCECGSITTFGHKLRHLKSKKHMDYINNL
jgi:hypothetical protein